MLGTSQHIPAMTRHNVQRRAFFKFPFTDLPAHDESPAQSYHERKILPYRRNELYKIIADVGSYSNFVPYCIDSRVLQSKARQDGIMVMQAELAVGFLAFKESYVSTVTCKPDHSVEAVAASSSPLFKTLTTIWRLHPASSPQPSISFSSTKGPPSPTPLDEGLTLVTLDIAFAFANPLHAAVSATFFGQLSKLMTNAFEQRCIAVYGPRNS